MMEWPAFISDIIQLLFAGGILTLVTLRDKKTAAILDNYDRVIKSWEETARERHARAEELKADLDKKDKKIDELYSENSELRNALDQERTERAKADMLKCHKLKCITREPPFGEGYKAEVNE